MVEENLTTVSIRRTDNKIIDSLKVHPKQPAYEVITELVKLATKNKVAKK